jgi:uncharacterized protein YbjT (DUF2867 family)
MAPTHSTSSVSVLLAGATGLVGQQALRQLLADPWVKEVRALVRREMTPAELLRQHDDVSASVPFGLDKLRVCVANFERLETRIDWFEVDWVFCALGTTMRQAGSQAAFRQVDFDYPLQIAQLAKAQGAKRFMLVSALGASARSRVFYSRVKGELEDALRAMGFEHLAVARPSLLAGERIEFRLGEKVGLLLGGLMPQRYKPVRAHQVAAGLIASAKGADTGPDADAGSACRVIDNVALRCMR